jgi:hypothetical protein
LNSDQILRAVNNWEVTAELVGGPDFTHVEFQSEFFIVFWVEKIDAASVGLNMKMNMLFQFPSISYMFVLYPSVFFRWKMGYS